MKAVILAGGQGSRLAASGETIPKPVVPIGGRPLLWHLMSYLAGQGVDMMQIALGHHADRIRKVLTSIAESDGDGAELDFTDGPRSWRAQPVDTGEATETGGRLGRLRAGLDGTFLLAWSDGLMNVDLRAMARFHRDHDRLATVLAVRPPSRFGRLRLAADDRVTAFTEKRPADDEWINGGLFLLEPAVLDYIDGDTCRWEYDVLPRLATAGELMAWRHEGFWQCVDYTHEAAELDALWRAGRAPWRGKDRA